MIKPTNVVVTVRQARHLIIKAKDGVNKAYATIQLLKDKYMTDVEESLIPKWQTKCSFPLTPGTFLLVFCQYYLAHLPCYICQLHGVAVLRVGYRSYVMVKFIAGVDFILSGKVLAHFAVSLYYCCIFSSISFYHYYL